MDIEAEVRDVYGRRTVYPVCRTAKLLAKLSGNKTFTASSITTLKELGYKIKVVQPEEKLWNLLGI
jgi:hypothetical protein